MSRIHMDTFMLAGPAYHAADILSTASQTAQQSAGGQSTVHSPGVSPASAPTHPGPTNTEGHAP